MRCMTKSKRHLPIVNDPDAPKRTEKRLLQIQEPRRDWYERAVSPETAEEPHPEPSDAEVAPESP